MQLSKLAIGLSVLIMCGGSATAEPITARYEITLTSRTDIQTVGDQTTTSIEPFDQQFLLALTFDSLRQGAGYGPPGFSAIPLPVVLEPADLPLTPFAFTIHGVVGPFGARAVAEHSLSGVNDDVLYGRSVRLERLVLSSGPFTAAEFPIHLHSGTFSFREAFSLQTGDESRSITYEGTAALVDTSVVPEPATLLLGGSGLVILAKIRKRKPKVN